MTDHSPVSDFDPTSETGGERQLAGVLERGATGALHAGEGRACVEPLDLAKILREYEARLLRYAANLLGGAYAAAPATADRGSPGLQPGDLVQEAFLRLHRYCRENGSSAIDHPGTWLYRVVHNLAMDAIRKRVRERGVQPKLADAARLRAAAADASDEESLEQLDQRELVALAMRLLGDLPEQQQQAITLKFMEGLTLRQIATILDSSPGSVNYHLNQGLSRLAQQLRKKGVL